MPCVNKRAWKIQKKGMIQNFLNINEKAWKIQNKVIIWDHVKP